MSEQPHKRTAMLLITEISLWRSVGRVSYTDGWHDVTLRDPIEDHVVAKTSDSFREKV